METLKAVFWKPDPAAQVRELPPRFPAPPTPPLLNPHQTKTNEGGGETDAKMQRPDPRKHSQTRPRHVPTQTTRAKNQTIHTPIVQKGPKTTIPSQTSRGRDPHLRPRTRPHPQTKLPPSHKQSPITERTDASE